MTEEEPLPPQELPAKMRIMAEPLHHVEDVVVKAGGAALRYGPFYGPMGKRMGWRRISRTAGGRPAICCTCHRVVEAKGNYRQPTVPRAWRAGDGVALPRPR